MNKFYEICDIVGLWLMVLIPIALLCYGFYRLNLQIMKAENDRIKAIASYYEGNHELLSLNNKEVTNKSSSFSGGFFLFVGSISGQESSTTTDIVKFIWKNNEGVFLPCMLPYNKIGFIIDETCEKPWVNITRASGIGQIEFAVFTIKSSQICRNIQYDFK